MTNGGIITPWQEELLLGEGVVNNANFEEGWGWTLRRCSQIWQLRGSGLDNHELQSLTEGVTKCKWRRRKRPRTEGHWACPAVEAARRWVCGVTTLRSPALSACIILGLSSSVEAFPYSPMNLFFFFFYPHRIRFLDF